MISIVLICMSTVVIGNTKQLTVFQINIWQEGTMIEKGYEAILTEIIDKDADIVMLSEVRNYHNQDFIKKIISSLKARGVIYYGQSSPPNLDVAVLSKYPIREQKPLYEPDQQIGAVLKSKVTIYGKNFLFYAVHLDYTNYACYLPRGYDGVTWKKLEHRITDVDQILLANRKSKRDDAIRDIIKDIESEAADQTIIIAGDFNEPSHLDWTEATKDLFDHYGAIVPWDCSVLLEKAQFIDAYRTFYPNPVSHPGFTFAAFNKDAKLADLTWAPAADDRDRIDYIYFRKEKNLNLNLTSIKIVGPVETICYGIKQEKDSQDQFILPKNKWPSDHKGLLATFTWK